MVNPVSDNSKQLILPINELSKHKDPFQKNDDSPQINVSLSEKAQELNKFKRDDLLTDLIKKEFNEVFELGGDKKNLFLKKLDHIFLSNRL